MPRSLRNRTVVTPREIASAWGKHRGVASPAPLREEGDMKSIKSLACLAIPLVLVGCGGGGNNTGDSSKAVNDVKVTGITTGSNFSFDLGLVTNGKYYLTDRNNKALDVIDINT